MRTIAQIEQEILDAKSDIPYLDVLNSTSRVSIWRLFIYIVAVAIYIHEQFFYQYKNEIEGIVQSAHTGTLRWYRNEVLKFQYNRVLEWNGTQFQYDTIDEDAQIVKHCAVVEANDSSLLVKVAKGESPNLVPISSDELASLTSYLQDVKFAGTRIAVSSNVADDLRVYYTVYYNPIIELAIVKQNVENAITNYIQNLPFDGVLNITRLTDSIQTVEGVRDVVFTSADAKYGVLPYTPITREYYSNAGYMSISNAFPLSDTITYVAL